MGILLLGFERDRVSEAQLARIRELTPDLRLLVTRDREEIEAVVEEIEIAAGGFPRGLIGRARNLRWLQQWGAGANWLMEHPEAVEMDFVLTNVSGVHAIPIGEHILALILAFGRGIHKAVRAQGRRDWSHLPGDSIFELVGKTMVLIGVGAIGERTAEIASALGVRVLGVRRDPSLGAHGVAEMFGEDQLLDVLPEADFVVLTAPLTHETEGMIGEPELRALKSTALIFSIGRGGTIQQPVLIRALQEGWIAGAGLDVFEEEPLPEDPPLWGMENVIITAHYAGATPHYDAHAMDIFVENLRRYRAGEPMRNVVDKTVGY